MAYGIWGWSKEDKETIDRIHVRLIDFEEGTMDNFLIARGGS